MTAGGTIDYSLVHLLTLQYKAGVRETAAAAAAFDVCTQFSDMELLLHTRTYALCLDRCHCASKFG